MRASQVAWRTLEQIAVKPSFPPALDGPKIVDYKACDATPHTFNILI
jgi:hypothetical protein